MARGELSSGFDLNAVAPLCSDARVIEAKHSASGHRPGKAMMTFYSLAVGLFVSASPLFAQKVPVLEKTLSNGMRVLLVEREDETTAIQWTLWGRQAENAAEYLGKGSHVNIVGHVRNNNFSGADGETVYTLAFTGEEIDYLDSKTEAEARRGRHEFVADMNAYEKQAKPNQGQHNSSRKQATT